MYRLDGRSRRVAHANLQMALPEKSGDEHRSIAIQSFRTFARTSLDLFWFSRHTAARLRRYVEYDPSFDAYFRHAPVIAVCAHYGNWEVMGQAAALSGAPSVSVAAPVRNRSIDRQLQRLRSLTGQQILPQSGAARGLLRSLRAGCRIALLVDQNTRISEGGRWVLFFGLPVPVSGIVELLAERTGTPVMTVYGCPRADGVYVAEAGAVIEPGQMARTPGALTAALLSDLEQRIRSHPGHWLWMYKRWKYIAQDTAADCYPFYARLPANRGRTSRAE